MDKEELVYDVVVRVESKLDKHLEESANHVGRLELIGWLTLVGGAIVLGIGI